MRRDRVPPQLTPDGSFRAVFGARCALRGAHTTPVAVLVVLPELLVEAIEIDP